MSLTYHFELHDRPVTSLSVPEKLALTSELRALGSLCLDPLPDYQCFSSSPNNLDDKFLVLARDPSSGTLLAFVSAVFLPSIRLPSGIDSGPICHAGLTCVHPKYRRSRLTISLFHRVFLYLITAYPNGIWITSVAEVLSSLVSFGSTVADTYPSPSVRSPSPNHIAIAEYVCKEHRVKSHISPPAYFDRDAFVIRGSNGPGSPFRKDVDAMEYSHRDSQRNDYYRRLFRRNAGDEVLQVGFLSHESATLMQALDEITKLTSQSKL